jgi:hypothetical protein
MLHRATCLVPRGPSARVSPISSNVRG